ncbi:MRPL9 [Bugula neritina]|uniref:MRPL9 n=1 Tax=Bugula neritina TaxID=10212 RepID=A0A7J7JFK0_BUGNE|nr:MRPL9 [Bugula neritina]
MSCMASQKFGVTWRAFLCNKVAQLLQSRSTVVLRRKHPVPLVPLERAVYERKLKEKHYIYEVVKLGGSSYVPMITCILTRHVDEYCPTPCILCDIIGCRYMLCYIIGRRTRLQPVGAAVYASPENIKEYEEINRLTKHEARKTQYALSTYRLLCGLNLPVSVNAFAPWTLTKSHIRISLRIAGVNIEDEDSISLPEEAITNSQDEKTPFQVKINGLDEAVVNCYKVPITSDSNRESELPERYEVPLHRKRADVSRELKEKGLYDGTV